MTPEVPELQGGPESLRLFTAIELPADQKQQVASLIVRLQKGFDFGGAYPAWVPAENLHLTLVFLGSQPADRIPQVVLSMQEAAKDAAPLTLSLGELELFPSPRQPKVISLGIRGQTARITPVFRRLHDSLAAAGFSLDDREFRPHLTLARINSLRGSAAIRSVLSSHSSFSTQPFQADSIVLYQSILKKPKPEYQILHRVSFGANDTAI